MITMKTKFVSRLIVSLAVAGLFTMTGVAMAQPNAAASPAAQAKAPANRGRVVGAPCHGSDGYQPDYSKLRAKPAAATAGLAPDKIPPINLVSFVDASTPLPREPHQLPPGRAYC